MRLRIIDGDPEQTGRIRSWLSRHPDYELIRDSRHRIWRLSDGEQEITGPSWNELLGALDETIAGETLRPLPNRYGPPPQPQRRHRPPAPPDITA